MRIFRRRGGIGRAIPHPRSFTIEIIVTDRASVEAGLVVRASYVLISIRDPDKPPVRYRRGGGCRAVLELAFHDAEPTPGFQPTRPITLMTEDDAKAIWAFVQKHAADVGAIVVHCEQGMSRSPAVAAGIAKGVGVDGQRFFSEFQPNGYVYDLINETMS